MTTKSNIESFYFTTIESLESWVSEQIDKKVAEMLENNDIDALHELKKFTNEFEKRVRLFKKTSKTISSQARLDMECKIFAVWLMETKYWDIPIKIKPK